MDPLLLQAADNGTDWPEAMIAIAGITFVMVIAVVLIWQVASSFRARMSLAREEAYRKLAEDSVSTQQGVMRQQETMASDIAELKTRIEGIEKLLREVG